MQPESFRVGSDTDRAFGLYHNNRGSVNESPPSNHRRQATVTPTVERVGERFIEDDARRGLLKRP
jgi:hypothetical protein